jgi:endonuclease/exonuclease/phosphatase family metal-dependent hydrolase
MRLLTFNIRINVASDGINAWPHRIGMVAQIIRNGDYPIIGLQEPNLLMVEDLLKALPLYRYTGIPRDERLEMTPIFYRPDIVTLVSSRTIWLSDTPETVSKFQASHFPRIATLSTFKTADGTIFRFVNTHLDYVNGEIQKQQMQVLVAELKRLDKTEALPVILTGDFNAVLDDPVNTYLRRVSIGNQRLDSIYGDINPNATFHDFKGGTAGEPIDYVYLSQSIQNTGWKVIRTDFNGLYPSDHYPVEFSVEFFKRKENKYLYFSGDNG